MSKSDAKPGTTSFRDLKLSEPLIRVLDEIGYETPTPIQSQAIPPLMNGRDILGHAPTGTGKTAAFALPLLSGINVQNKNIQVLTLTPTRELAIQVAEARSDGEHGAGTAVPARSPDGGCPEPSQHRAHLLRWR